MQAKLKADPSTRDIPVIFLTALTDAEDERTGSPLALSITSTSRSRRQLSWPVCKPT